MTQILVLRRQWTAILFAIHAVLLCCGNANADDQDPPTQIEFTSSDFWETLDGRPVDENWEFDADEIRLVRPRGGQGSIISKPLPSHFELSWEWKIDEGTNTGLKYRARKFGNRYLGIEYQIIDDQSDSRSRGSTASIYDLFAPSADKPLNAVGQWNQSRIVASGNRLEHYLNGQEIAVGFTAGTAWDSAIALSKFYGASDFGRAGESDRIMLTDHGGKADFRNFSFQTLQPTTSDLATPESSGPFLGNALRNSWADQQSIVIWTRTTKHPEMNVDGKPFIPLSKSEARQLSKVTDPAVLLGKQLPDEAKLEEMFGACPGAPGFVRLTYFPGKQSRQAKTTPWTATTAKSDFTAQWKLDGLKPDTQYAAIVQCKSSSSGDVSAVVRGGFQTAPEMDKKADVRFCVTTCHDFIRRDDGMNGHKIYRAMNKLSPDFVVHAGDIEYYDKPDPWAMTRELMRFKWGRIFALPHNREFYSRTTSYFLKDDHDTLMNDCWAGQRYGAVTFEEGVRIFNEEQFPSLTPRYTTVRWGRDLQVWFLEGRDYRSPNNADDGPEKTILGEEQKQWLFDTLGSSDATFKLICSPTPIVGPDRKNKSDNHANDVFAYEGDQIRKFLAEIDNVIVLCGDRHWQYASFDPETDLWEFGCGPGSEKHQIGWKSGDERPLHQFLRVKGGFLSGKVNHRGDPKQPVLTLRHRTVTGEAVSEFKFPRVDE